MFNFRPVSFRNIVKCRDTDDPQENWQDSNLWPTTPTFPLVGLGGGLAPLVASVPETDALRYPACNLLSPTPLLVVPLPIAGNPRAGRP
ncbi:hypothetical protein Syun_012436 [Stephania yunnanensis]|uniref:Uncharacterized protein n=1 Tax=Stephania yunnanensis TaxID=152371 RepID=A0AAP0PJH0_9MAGN